MRVGIFDPYLDTLGGGEKYIFDICRYLSANNEVFFFWNDRSILKEAEKRFSINLSNVKLIDNIFSPKIPLIKRILATKKYDLIIYVSDGSIPLLLAKKNILIFQFPVNWINGKSLVNKIKLSRINKIICYSNFVKIFLDKTFSKKATVLPPSVELPKIRSFKKENIILTVGRFTKNMNAKKQRDLINVFKTMCDNGLKGWKFVLIGSVLQKDYDFVDNLKLSAKNYPIEILTNLSFDKLLDYYKKAKIYWHATGYGEDLEKYPEYAEHFGISTVEAMGGGAVPVVINAGGQKEIVQNGVNGFLWESLGDLEEKTLKLIKDEKLWQRMSERARKRAEFFAGDRFCKEIKKLI